MRSLQKFMGRLYGKDFLLSVGDLSQRLRGQLGSDIPIFGLISMTETKANQLAGYQHNRTISIYPVAELEGEPWMWLPTFGEINLFLEIEKSSDEFQTLPQYFSDMIATYWQINLPIEKMGFLRGVSKNVEIDSGYQSYQWVILYLCQGDFDIIQRVANLSVIADSVGMEYLNNCPMLEDEAYRIVYPRELVITDMGEVGEDNVLSVLELEGKGQIRFVRFHRNCAEYVTQTGVRIFDNREKKIGGLPCWKVALRQYVDTLKPTTESILSVKVLAWVVLSQVVDGQLNNASDSFGNNLKLLTGSEYLPSSLFWDANKELRVAFRDKHKWSYDIFFFNDIDVMNPYYIVVKD